MCSRKSQTYSPERRLYFPLSGLCFLLSGKYYRVFKFLNAVLAMARKSLRSRARCPRLYV
jgi:hypothetical protein